MPIRSSASLGFIFTWRGYMAGNIRRVLNWCTPTDVSVSDIIYHSDMLTSYTHAPHRHTHIYIYNVYVYHRRKKYYVGCRRRVSNGHVVFLLFLCVTSISIYTSQPLQYSVIEILNTDLFIIFASYCFDNQVCRSHWWTALYQHCLHWH